MHVKVQILDSRSIDPSLALEDPPRPEGQAGMYRRFSHRGKDNQQSVGIGSHQKASTGPIIGDFKGPTVEGLGVQRPRSGELAASQREKLA